VFSGKESSKTNEVKEFTFETEEKKTESQVQPLQVLSDYDSEKEEENA